MSQPKLRIVLNMFVLMALLSTLSTGLILVKQSKQGGETLCFDVRVATHCFKCLANMSLVVKIAKKSLKNLSRHLRVCVVEVET